MTGSGQPPAAIDWGAGRRETTAGLSRICEVLVAGAGPGGLVAAITLARYGIDVVLIDKRSTLSGLSRSLVISTRGMELMRRLGSGRRSNG
jgi:2-polyprenyl-6-methoxyphenol hydroxylase-like FAD-dependent oxidoreductase